MVLFARYAEGGCYEQRRHSFVPGEYRFHRGGTTPQAVADYHPSAEAQQRVAELIAREKERGLPPEEKAELDRFMDLEHILRMAKARAPALRPRFVNAR